VPEQVVAGAFHLPAVHFPDSHRYSCLTYCILNYA
jgi:hypothetical protein